MVCCVLMHQAKPNDKAPFDRWCGIGILNTNTLIASPWALKNSLNSLWCFFLALWSSFSLALLFVQRALLLVFPPDLRRAFTPIFCSVTYSECRAQNTVSHQNMILISRTLYHVRQDINQGKIWPCLTKKRLSSEHCIQHQWQFIGIAFWIE